MRPQQSPFENQRPGSGNDDGWRRPGPRRGESRRGPAPLSHAPDDGTLARAEAMRILMRWMETGEFPDRMFGGIPPFRRPFVMDLTYTAVRRCRALDWVLEDFVQRRPESAATQAALLLGAAQIREMTTVAPHAAVSATVEALKLTAGRDAQTGLVNAVLRNLLRAPGRADARLADAPLAVRASHTDEQTARWMERFGAERARALLEWDDTPAGVTLLPLPGRSTVTGLLRSLAEAGVSASPHPGRPNDAVCIPHGSRVDSLPGFAEGLFTIQDPATLEAVRLLDARPGMRVLDACAAPGGKTAQIAAAMNGQGELFAMDCWRDRLDPLRENLARLRFDSFVKTGVGDAKRCRARDFGARGGGAGLFDRILADVPCSNTGVQRRRADARWRFDPERLSALAETQAAILENLATGLLAPGGRIVYSTCSVEPEENEGVVEAFLARHPGQFERKGQVALVPPDFSCDGAFAACIERKAP